MNKRIGHDAVYFSIAWSKLFKYHKHAAARVLPELPGILYFYSVTGKKLTDLLCFGCWREGLRMGMRDLFDAAYSKQPYLTESLADREMYYKYCVVDTNPSDMKDIMYYLIRTHSPELNDFRAVEDSKRYRDICVDEVTIDEPNYGREGKKGAFYS